MTNRITATSVRKAIKILGSKNEAVIKFRKIASKRVRFINTADSQPNTICNSSIGNNLLEQAKLDVIRELNNV